MRLLTVLGGIALGLLAPKPAPAQAQGLFDYRWEARLVLVFAPTKTAPPLIAQRAVFKAATEGLAERDIVVHTVLPDRVTPDLGTLARDDAPTLRARHAVEAGAFAVILIGKDGGEKLRSETVLMTDRLFATIDAMPMRRREMERNGPDPDGSPDRE